MQVYETLASLFISFGFNYIWTFSWNFFDTIRFATLEDKMTIFSLIYILF